MMSGVLGLWVSFNPSSSSLGTLFRNPYMFESADDWADEGFEILRASDNKITVASHPSVPGYLFKKYVSSGKREALDDQLDNYQTRLEGARRLRRFIDDEKLRHVTVPRKWLRTLPEEHGTRREPSHILIVERLGLLDVDASEQAYRRIDERVLHDLCVVLYAFRGLDSTVQNLPHATDGKIAFIDTEHWNRHGDREKSRQRPWFKHLNEHLSRSSLKFAAAMWDRLSGDDDRADDFDDEEGTSSSLSS
jgi:hypothetical protein